MTALVAEPGILPAETGHTAARTCDARMEMPDGRMVFCDLPPMGRFLTSCEHGHAIWRLLCGPHAQRPERGLCPDCLTLPDFAAHRCPIVLSRLEDLR